MNKKAGYPVFHSSYVDMRKLIEPNCTEFGDIVNEIDDPEERRFLSLVTDFFLQKKQREYLAAKGVSL